MTNKKVIVFISLFFAFNVFFPIKVQAKNVNSYINQVTIKSLDSKIECTGNKGILGDVNNDESVAWLLQKILNYIKILGPMIAIVLGSLDFVKAIITSDEDSMKKSQKRFINRLIAAIILFFIPLLVEILLELFGFTSDITCGLK